MANSSINFDKRYGNSLGFIAAEGNIHFNGGMLAQDPNTSKSSVVCTGWLEPLEIIAVVQCAAGDGFYKSFKFVYLSKGRGPGLRLARAVRDGFSVTSYSVENVQFQPRDTAHVFTVLNNVQVCNKTLNLTALGISRFESGVVVDVVVVLDGCSIS